MQSKGYRHIQTQTDTDKQQTDIETGSSETDMDRQTYSLRHRDDKGSGQIKRQTANQFSRLEDLQAEIDTDTAADRHTLKETDVQ